MRMAPRLNLVRRTHRRDRAYIEKIEHSKRRWKEKRKTAAGAWLQMQMWWRELSTSQAFQADIWRVGQR